MKEREKSVCVRLKTEWCGNPKGKILKLSGRMAASLFQRDAAEIMRSDDQGEVKKKLQRKEHDKMIRSSVNK